MENPRNQLSALEADAIGEILNISMGAAATAISTMLDKKVEITTPMVAMKLLKEIDYAALEPAIIVKITYLEGIRGCNVMVFRQRDMQMLLNQLMGNDEPPVPDFEFDELSISAACEVMNQMMGASATALSEFLGKNINISTPSAHPMDENHTFGDAMGVRPEEEIVSILFRISIADIMDSEFISVMSLDLAKGLVSQFVDAQEDTLVQQTQPEAAVPPAYQMEQQAPPPMQQMPVQQAMPVQQPMQQQAYQQVPQQQQQYATPAYYTSPPAYPQGGFAYPAPMPPAQEERPRPMAEPVNVKSIQVPHFSTNGPAPVPAQPGGNMELIMNVPLGVSVEIGKTKRKVKEILEFTQGTIIELEKQAGAPVDIIVNGQLIARGDVVVIEDNFGVRITEIVNTRDLLTRGNG